MRRSGARLTGFPAPRPPVREVLMLRAFGLLLAITGLISPAVAAEKPCEPRPGLVCKGKLCTNLGTTTMDGNEQAIIACLRTGEGVQLMWKAAYGEEGGGGGLMGGCQAIPLPTGETTTQTIDIGLGGPDGKPNGKFEQQTIVKPVNRPAIAATFGKGCLPNGTFIGDTTSMDVNLCAKASAPGYECGPTNPAVVSGASHVTCLCVKSPNS